MNKYKIVRKELSVDNVSSTYTNNKIERLFSNESIDIAKYHLCADSILYIDPNEQPGYIKTYTVLTGKIMDLETNAEWITGDLILIDTIDTYLSIIATEDTILLVHAEQSSAIKRYEKSSEQMIIMLNNLQMKDHYTKEHSDRVYGLVKHFALKLGYHSRALYNLNKAARFHDIGKVFIPDEILNKPSKLSPEEYLAIQSHATLGKELILETYNPEIFEIVAQHHERWNGSGYPLGLKSDAISEGARILAICDSFDAMTSNRVYSNAKSVNQALNEITALAGVLYDPKLVDVFVNMMREL